jgi:hypothetical protein
MLAKETKADRFARIGERRVNDVLRALRLLGNLADRHNYDYTEEQATSILRAVDDEYRTLRSKFKAEAPATAKRFHF